MIRLREGEAAPIAEEAAKANSPRPEWQVARFEKLRTLATHPAVTNTAWILLERVGRIGIALLVGVVVVRHLGAERYGLYVYTLTLASLFVPLAGCGIGENLVRHLVGDEGLQDRVLGTACLLRAAAAILAAALTAGVFCILPNTAATTPWDLAAALAAMSALPLMVLDPYFQSLSRSRVVTACGLGAGIIAAAAKITAVAASAPVMVFLAAHAVEAILVGVGLLAAYQLVCGPARRWRFDQAIAVTLLREGLPTVLAGFAIMVYNQSDILLLGILRNDHEVGIYGAAVRLSTLWLFLPMAVLTSAAPFLYRAQNTDAALYRSRLLATMSLVVGLCYAFAIVMAVFPEAVTNLLFGAEYAEAAPVLRVHVWSNVFAMLGMAQSTWYIGRGLLWVGFRNTLIGAGVNFVLNIIIIPSYGPSGAAATTLLATILTSVVLNSIDTRTRALATIQARSLMLDGFRQMRMTLRAASR